MQTSESIAKLAPALLAAKKEFEPALKTANNPFFNSKYADLAGVIHATEPYLSKHGLMVLQSPTGCTASQSIGVVTRIIHESGEWIEGQLELTAVGKGKDGKEKFDAQSAGSGITYARRYAYMGILGIPAEDDDGNHASGHNDKPTVQRASAKPAPARDSLDSAFLQPEDFPLPYAVEPVFDENGNLVGDAWLDRQPPVSRNNTPITQIAKAGQFDAHGDAISDGQAKLIKAVLIKSGRIDELGPYLKSIGISKIENTPKKLFPGVKQWAGVVDTK